MIFKMSSGRYAKALYEVAADAGDLDTVKDDIKTVETIFKQLPELKKYSISANVAISDAKIVVEEAFLKYLNSAKSANTLMLMAEYGRLASIPFLPEAFFAIIAEKENRLDVSAEFAHQPSDKALEKLKIKIAEHTGKTVSLNLNLNPDLLGGFLVKWRGYLIDNSVKGRLKQLRAEF